MDQGMNKQCSKDCSCMRCGSFFSWKAVFAGAFVGIGLAFLFNLFGVAVGLSAFTATSVAGLESLAMGGFLGIVIGIVVSMYIAGWVAGFLGRPYCARRNAGAIYGFVTWTLVLMIGTWFASQSAGRYVTVYTDFASRPATMGAEPQAAASAMMNVHEPKMHEVKAHEMKGHEVKAHEAKMEVAAAPTIHARTNATDCLHVLPADF